MNSRFVINFNVTFSYLTEVIHCSNCLHFVVWDIKITKKFSTFNHVRYKSLSIKCCNLARGTQRLRYNTLQVYRADTQTSSDYIPAQLTPCGYKSFMHDVVVEVTDIEQSYLFYKMFKVMLHHPFISEHANFATIFCKCNRITLLY